MLDMKFIRENLDEAERRLQSRGTGPYLEGFRALDEKRLKLIHESESLKALRNSVSDEIARTKDKSQAQDKILEMREVSQRIKGMDEELKQVDEELQQFLLTVPNLPAPETPIGASEADNVQVRSWGTPAGFGFTPKPHWEIGEELGILDFECGAKLTGARFTLYRGAGARLERALINFMLDLHTGEHGYLEVLPPFMVNRESMTGTGQLPKFEEDLFKMQDPEYFLIPTAEVPVTNIHRGEILKRSDLPILLCGLHPLLPPRGRLLRQGYPRPDPPAPVQQGRAGQVHPPLRIGCRTGKTDAGRREGPAAAGASLPGHGALQRRYRLLRRQDLRHRGLAAGTELLTARFHPAAPSATSRRGGPASASGKRRSPSRNSSIPSTVPDWRWGGRWWRSWKTASRRMVPL